MFTVLNRLRGTWSWMAKVVGIVIGIIFYVCGGDIYTSTALIVMYILGESFGWGKWMGGIYRDNVIPTKQQLADLEGRNNGIHFLANKIYPETKNYALYCFTALWIRGIYWVGLTLLPLLVGGYLDAGNYIVITALLGYGFPISVKIGMYTEDKFSFGYMRGFWEHSEVWYGVMQDIAFILVVLNVSMGG
jgi:hypothetical protein